MDFFSKIEDSRLIESLYKMIIEKSSDEIINNKTRKENISQSEGILREEDKTRILNKYIQDIFVMKDPVDSMRN